MNVVGRVGSLISQGVYSVATPFHPFGGAVDVIVVQQQDGTFRSTPWYVRFGKFQGVLKGAEKVVRITVNDVEANFHMYLDNSGEAYFVREVDTDKPNEFSAIEVKAHKDSKDQIVNETRRLEHSVSDSGVVQVSSEFNSLGSTGRIERSESDDERRFYDIHDEQSSFETSNDLSDYESSPFENVDGDGFVGSQDLSSEVVLVSVDGHVLTAPILASEKDAENVQLSTPQFHLGPGEETDYYEENEEFGSGENAWTADYISEINLSKSTVISKNICDGNDRVDSLEQQVEICEKESENICQSEETPVNGHVPSMKTESENLFSRTHKEDIFKSCLELTELPQLVKNADSENADSENADSSLEASNSLQNPSQNLRVVDASRNDGVSESKMDELPLNILGEVVQTEDVLFSPENKVEDNVSVSLDGKELHNESLTASTPVKGMDMGPEIIAPVNEFDEIDFPKSWTEASNGKIQTHSTPRFEMSLCGNVLCAGMGVDAAAEAFDAHRVTVEEFQSTSASIISNENLIIRFGEKYLTWEKASPIVLGKAAFGLDLPLELKDVIPVEQDDSQRSREDEPGITSTPSGRRWRLWPIPFRRVKTLEHSASGSSNEEVFVDSEPDSQNIDQTPMMQPRVESPRKQLLRTNIPTTEQIASLNLKEGQNMIAFTFSTRVLGVQKVDAHLYLWKWNARIVISDVDGTITKSDVLGQFMPLVGKDWTQSGVARLFSAIKENGYQLLFLSARAIVQAYLTRSFLLNLKQDGKALPNGPVVISPDGLFPSLFREVIRRAPHEFKIACLEDIKKLFPSDYNPFYAGFGNRDTDELSYRKIGIPKGKIFIINPKGEVAISHRIDVKSYTSLHTLVNDMFPPTSLLEQEDFNSWNYWRTPLPDLD